MSNFIIFSLSTFDALSNIFFMDREELSHEKQSVITSVFFQSNRFEFREECTFIFLTHPFSTRAQNNIFKYAQILAT